MSTQTSHMNNTPPLEGLNQTLEIELVEATRERVVMRMPVTLRHRHPWGFLHGGASLILAEGAVSVGAFLNCPADMGAFGQQIHAKLREGGLGRDSHSAACEAHLTGLGDQASRRA